MNLIFAKLYEEYIRKNDSPKFSITLYISIVYFFLLFVLLLPIKTFVDKQIFDDQINYEKSTIMAKYIVTNVLISDMHIRQARTDDYQEIYNVIQNAFEDVTHSHHDEHLLVERLRFCDAFIPELSLISEIDQQIVGYILCTKIKIIDKSNIEVPSLALAPVAVLKYINEKALVKD